jgi:hypothetical protein
MVRASSAVKSPVVSARCSTTHPHARPRVTITARISCGVPIGARYSAYRALRSGRPRVASLRIATGNRRPARLAKVLTSSRAYSLATTAAAASSSVSGVRKPPVSSSTGLAVVSNRVSGSSPCQQAASTGNTRRIRAMSSAWRTP